MAKPVVGVMGASENDALSESEKTRLKELAHRLGTALAKRECILITGATTGLPDLVAKAFRKQGGFALGISPAENRQEHVERYRLPEDGADVIVYTGFGYKGRNVINVRSSDIVIIFGGATGTLNEFTIAYDEGKVIGVLEESGGAIDFDLPEAELLFNDEGQIGGIVRSERNIAHRLIEEFMLLANETVATHLEKLDVPAVYRIHEEPDPSKIEEFQEVALSFGHKFSLHGPVPQHGFQHLLRQVEGRPEERMLSYLMLRSMERARYLPKNLGHFGLAMQTYTHFTSPIRRYPDLIVHRILREVLGSRADLEHGNEMDLGERS